MPADVTIEVLAAPVVNHAMAHNGLPFLHRISVATTERLAEVMISVRVVDDFGTVISRPWQHPSERVETETALVVDHPALRLDPAYLAGVEEETGAEIVVEVATGGAPVATTVHPIRVLASRQWTRPERTGAVLGAAGCVRAAEPPGVAGVGLESAQLLATATGSGSLAVSHVAPERIDQIVGAVFTAVHDREIFYAEPPAGWRYGQQIRTPGDVLTQRVGTCLDTTVLLASALEHVGIRR